MINFSVVARFKFWARGTGTEIPFNSAPTRPERFSIWKIHGQNIRYNCLYGQVLERFEHSGFIAIDECSHYSCPFMDQIFKAFARTTMSRACLQSKILKCNGDARQPMNSLRSFLYGDEKNIFNKQDKLGLNKLFDKFDGSSKAKPQAPKNEVDEEPTTPGRQEIHVQNDSNLPINISYAFCESMCTGVVKSTTDAALKVTSAAANVFKVHLYHQKRKYLKASLIFIL